MSDCACGKPARGPKKQLCDECWRVALAKRGRRERGGLCRDCDQPVRALGKILCERHHQEAVKRLRTRKHTGKPSKGLVRGACHVCGATPYAPRAWYCETHRAEVLRAQARAKGMLKRRREGRPQRDYEVCQNCAAAPPRTPRSKWCAECYVLIRKVKWSAERQRLGAERKEKVRELLILAIRRLEQMLRVNDLEGNTIRAIGRALAQVHVDGTDRWRENRRQKEAA